MHHGTRESFDYLECSACGCLQIAQIPGNLDRYYPPEYYAQVANPDLLRHGTGTSRLRRSWTTRRLSAGRFERLFAGRRYGRFEWFTRTATGVDDAVLDVGCGSGKLLWRLHREGFRDLTGIDPHLGPTLPTSPSGPTRTMEAGPRFERVAVEAHRGEYRLVMAHHSFEHVEDPRNAFRALARLVASGGWLLLRIPLADSWARHHYGADWVQLDAPRHLHLHTRRSIDRLAADFGFRVAHVVDDSGPFQVWGSELYRRGVPLVSSRSLRRSVLEGRTRATARIRTQWLRAVSRGDQACFYLQREVTP
ncbi:MAG: class I SAM-dependent methyltransferase [Myxococcota bacterium]